MWIENCLAMIKNPFGPVSTPASKRVTQCSVDGLYVGESVCSVPSTPTSTSVVSTMASTDKSWTSNCIEYPVEGVTWPLAIHWSLSSGSFAPEHSKSYPTSGLQQRILLHHLKAYMLTFPPAPLFQTRTHRHLLMRLWFLHGGRALSTTSDKDLVSLNTIRPQNSLWSDGYTLGILNKT